MKPQTSLILAAAVLTGCGSGHTENPPPQGDVVLGTESVATPKAAPAAKRRVRPAAKPPINPWPIPLPASRLRETAAYAERHYGRRATRLDPKVIVIHYSVTPTAQGVHDLFANDVPDTELHELPGTCSHFLVDRDGTIYQFVPVRLICRHTVGLNDVAIGIEHVGGSDAEVLGDAAQLRSSVRLTSWLRCRYGIAVKNVIGHNESLSSPFHHENVAALRTQTHDDFGKASMDRYRSLVRSSCP